MKVIKNIKIVYIINKIENKNIFYSTNIVTGIFGIMIYANQVYLHFIISKEIYRLQVNISGLKENET